MSKVINFPKQAYFGKLVTKTKIYEHTQPSAKVKKLFVDEVEKIEWAYKLSPETINIPEEGDVHEIQVFRLHLKQKNISKEILQIIDLAIPSPIIYELIYGDYLKYQLTYKRVNEADKTKWVVSDYFGSEWMPKISEKVELPIRLNIQSMYSEIINWFLPYPAKPNEDIRNHVERIIHIKQKEKELGKLEKKLKNEKQFKYQLELNSEINKLKTLLSELLEQ